MNNSNVPWQVPGMWQDIATGARFTCGIKLDLTLWCWGANDFGQLGDGTFGEHHEPEQIGADADWVQISAGGENACARKASGALWCWGRNLEGQVGDASAWQPDLHVVQ
jgi:alpha-tubulin suppressor-like RCC1 family protein